MSWRINLVKNEVNISRKIAEELLTCGADAFIEFDEWEGVTDLRGDGTFALSFNPEHMEHMDYVDDPAVQNVLKKHKVVGDICFSSEEGDNAGTAWGYRFDGKGGMVRLKGVRTFVPVAPESSTKVRKVATTKTSGKTLKKVTVGKKPVKKWACTVCLNDKALPEECQFGFPRGRDVRKYSSELRYCGTCGEDHSIKRV